MPCAPAASARPASQLHLASPIPVYTPRSFCFDTWLDPHQRFRPEVVTPEQLAVAQPRHSSAKTGKGCGHLQLWLRQCQHHCHDTMLHSCVCMCMCACVHVCMCALCALCACVRVCVHVFLRSVAAAGRQKQAPHTSHNHLNRCWEMLNHTNLAHVCHTPDEAMTLPTLKAVDSKTDNTDQLASTN